MDATEDTADGDGTGRVTAAILVIGDEILSGRTVDVNSSWLIGRLSGMGISPGEVRVVPDLAGEIVPAVRALRDRFDYLFTTGGIGPTHDDITTDCVAEALGVGVGVDPGARAMLEMWYGTRDISAARLRMARIPLGASLIDNPVSGAPGFRIGNVIVMAGIPGVCRAMFGNVAPGLRRGRRMLVRSFAAPVPESVVAFRAGGIQRAFPGVRIGCHPRRDGERAGILVVLRTTDPEQLEMADGEIREMFRAHGVVPVVTDDPDGDTGG